MSETVILGSVEAQKELCTELLLRAGLDPVQVWGLATTELLDLAEALDGAPIEADDAFCIGLALGCFYATDDGGISAPAPALPDPERTA